MTKCHINWYHSGPEFSKDFRKVMTILANEVIIAGPIGPAINISLAKIVLPLLESFENPGQGLNLEVNKLLQIISGSLL